MTTEESLLTRILQTLNDTLRRMSGSQKTSFYGGLGAHTGLDHQSLSIREDATVFSALVCTNGTTTLGFSDFYTGTTATLKGDLLSAPAGYRFTSFTLTAGSVTGS
jgi:hypothetical protein